MRDSVSEFLDIGNIKGFDWVILCCGGYPINCRMLSSVIGLCPFGASSTYPALSTIVNNTYRCYQISLGKDETGDHSG